MIHDETRIENTARKIATQMVSVEKMDPAQFEKEELLRLLETVQHELKKKKVSLRDARTRLAFAKNKIKTLKETVDYQRKRIVDLYKDQPGKGD